MDIDYKGTQTEKETVVYFFKNSRQLKKVSIESLASTNLNDKHKMLLELASAQRIASVAFVYLKLRNLRWISEIYN